VWKVVQRRPHEGQVGVAGIRRRRLDADEERIGVGQVIPMLEERIFDVYRLVEGPSS